MDNAERYRKDLDLIFQEIEEKARLQEQAITEKVLAFADRLRKKWDRTLGLSENWSIEEQQTFIRAAVRKEFPNLHFSN